MVTLRRARTRSFSPLYSVHSRCFRTSSRVGLSTASPREGRAARRRPRDTRLRRSFSSILYSLLYDSHRHGAPALLPFDDLLDHSRVGWRLRALNTSADFTPSLVRSHLARSTSSAVAMSPDVADDDVERRDARADALATRDGAEHGARAVSESMESQTRLDVDVDDAERTQNATDVEEAKKVGDEEARRALERAPDRERRLEAVVRDEEINAEDVLSDEAPPGLEDDEETADGDLEARAVAAAISGVRIDGRVTRTFGVLIPNTTTTAASNESQISIARRRAKASASLAWRTRLESLAPDESSDQVERTIDIRARTYEETTSKYINMSYFEKRVAPLMTHPDGRRNDTTARVARWIFGEQYIKRDGFVDEESDEEIETTGENKIEDDVEK